MLLTCILMSELPSIISIKTKRKRSVLDPDPVKKGTSFSPIFTGKRFKESWNKKFRFFEVSQGGSGFFWKFGSVGCREREACYPKILSKHGGKIGLSFIQLCNNWTNKQFSIAVESSYTIAMVIKLDGYTEICAHVRVNTSYHLM